MKRGKRGRKSSLKQSLNLPDLEQAKSTVLNGLPSKASQRPDLHARNPRVKGPNNLGVRLGNWLTEMISFILLARRLPQIPVCYVTGYSRPECGTGNSSPLAIMAKRRRDFQLNRNSRKRDPD
jgi:hypothetical protein